jgi:hypothetical protein
MAKSLLLDGEDILKVMKHTKLPIEEIEKLQSELTKEESA